MSLNTCWKRPFLTVTYVYALQMTVNAVNAVNAVNQSLRRHKQMQNHNALLELTPLNTPLNDDRRLNKRPDLLTNDDEKYGQVRIEAFEIIGSIDFFQSHLNIAVSTAVSSSLSSEASTLEAFEIYLYQQIKHVHSVNDGDYVALKAIRFNHIHGPALIPSASNDDSYRMSVGSGKAYFENRVLLDIPDSSEMNSLILSLLTKKYEDATFATITPMPTPVPSPSPTPLPSASPTPEPTIGETNPPSISFMPSSLPTPTSFLSGSNSLQKEVVQTVVDDTKPTISTTPIVLGALGGLSLLVGAAVMLKKRRGYHSRDMVHGEEESEEEEGEEVDYVIEITTE